MAIPGERYFSLGPRTGTTSRRVPTGVLIAPREPDRTLATRSGGNHPSPCERGDCDRYDENHNGRDELQQTSTASLRGAQKDPPRLHRSLGL